MSGLVSSSETEGTQPPRSKHLDCIKLSGWRGQMSLLKSFIKDQMSACFFKSVALRCLDFIFAISLKA